VIASDKILRQRLWVQIYKIFILKVFHLSNTVNNNYLIASPYLGELKIRLRIDDCLWR
jgi:hypothetical protein